MIFFVLFFFQQLKKYLRLLCITYVLYYMMLMYNSWLKIFAKYITIDSKRTLGHINGKYLVVTWKVHKSPFAYLRSRNRQLSPLVFEK